MKILQKSLYNTQLSPDASQYYLWSVFYSVLMDGSRPLNSHDLIVRHTISAFISRPLADLTISHDFQNFQRNDKSPWFKARNVSYYISRDHLSKIVAGSCIFTWIFGGFYNECQTLTLKGENFWIKRYKVRNRVNPTSGVISNVYCLISCCEITSGTHYPENLCWTWQNTESTAGY